MKYFFLLMVGSYMATSCKGQNLNDQVVSKSKMQKDSVGIVANYFLEFSIYCNSYAVSERDIYEVHLDHKHWVKKYFPEILKWDITLYSRFTIACYLYLEGQKKYLIDFWDKYKGMLTSTEQLKYRKDMELFKIKID